MTDTNQDLPEGYVEVDGEVYDAEGNTMQSDDNGNWYRVEAAPQPDAGVLEETIDDGEELVIVEKPLYTHVQATPNFSTTSDIDQQQANSVMPGAVDLPNTDQRAPAPAQAPIINGSVVNTTKSLGS